MPSLPARYSPAFSLVVHVGRSCGRIAVVHYKSVFISQLDHLQDAKPDMKTHLLSLLLIALCVLKAAVAAEPAYRDIYPDTWVASDGLGRIMPDYSVVGPVKTDQRRVVGIFYITWHRDSLAGRKKPYAADVTKILKTDPKARLDAKHPLWTEGSYHWGEPELGYFLSKDRYVIRRDMSMLADAGVDVLIMDVTNAELYWDEWNVLFQVMEKMRAELEQKGIHLSSGTNDQTPNNLQPFRDAQRDFERQQSLLDALNVYLKLIVADNQLQESPVLIVSRAETPEAPANPNKARDLIVVIVVGGFLSIVVAAFIEMILLFTRASERTGN